MRNRRIQNRVAIAMAMLAVLSCDVPRATADAVDQRQTNWAGLSAVVGQRVRVLMPDGARIEGKATGLEVDALAIEVTKSSNRKAYPKGRFLLSRATLRAVDVLQPSSIHWRIICTALGGGIGYVAMRGAINAAKSSSTGGAVGLGALGVGLPVAGYLIGNAADRRIVTYVIVP
jgi:hypothetical protein